MCQKKLFKQHKIFTSRNQPVDRSKPQLQVAQMKLSTAISKLTIWEPKIKHSKPQMTKCLPTNRNMRKESRLPSKEIRTRTKLCSWKDSCREQVPLWNKLLRKQSSYVLSRIDPKLHREMRLNQNHFLDSLKNYYLCQELLKNQPS